MKLLSLLCWLVDHHRFGPWYDNPCAPNEFSRVCGVCGAIEWHSAAPYAAKGER